MNKLFVGVSLAAVVAVGWFSYSLGSKLAAETKAHAATTADLRTCQGNFATLKAALQNQSDSIWRLGAESNLRLSQVQEMVKSSSRATERALAASKIMAPPPVGDTVCERVQEVDARVLEMLAAETLR